MKKFLLINSLSAGGAEKIITTLANELNGEFKSIELICLEKNNFYNLENTKIHYLSERDGSQNSILKFIYIFILAFKLKKFVLKNNAELVQSHLYQSNFVNIISTILGSKHVTHIVNHGIISLYKGKGILGKVNLFLIKHLYHRADLIIFISQMMKLDFLNLYKVKNQLQVIHNPYDINEILNRSRKKIDFIFEKDKKYLLSVGRLISLKRNKDLLYALKKLPEAINVIFLGDGVERENLLTLTKKLNLEDRVFILGNVSNPYAFMKQSFALISCSESEGFPNVLIESLVCELPIISTDCISGPREILSPNSNISIQIKNKIEISEYGLLYPISDINMLIEAIKLLINESKIRNNYIIKGKSRANTFSVKKIIEEYKKVLGIE